MRDEGAPIGQQAISSLDQVGRCHWWIATNFKNGIPLFVNQASICLKLLQWRLGVQCRWMCRIAPDVDARVGFDCGFLRQLSDTWFLRRTCAWHRRQQWSNHSGDRQLRQTRWTPTPPIFMPPFPFPFIFISSSHRYFLLFRPSPLTRLCEWHCRTSGYPCFRHVFPSCFGLGPSTALFSLPFETAWLLNLN